MVWVEISADDGASWQPFVNNMPIVPINDIKVTEFKGIPPKGGGLVGLDFGSSEGDSGPTTFTFTNFQVRALADHVQEKIREVGSRVYGVEGESSGEWVLVDLGDVIVGVARRLDAHVLASLARFLALRHDRDHAVDGDDLLAANREFAADFALSGFDGAAPVTFAQPSSSDVDGSVRRTWHEDIDGNAHYGLLSDYIQEIRLEGNADHIKHLYNSAEAYLQTWQRTQASSIAIQTNGLKAPSASILRPAPPVGDFAP